MSRTKDPVWEGKVKSPVIGGPWHARIMLDAEHGVRVELREKHRDPWMKSHSEGTLHAVLTEYVKATCSVALPTKPKTTIETNASPPLEASPPDPRALFQVDDGEPIPFERLMRVNAELEEEDRARIAALDRVGAKVAIGHTVVRRTR